jgi:methylenetetrahydrofolate dehydrogenase (NADP+)/methenyltetrahydrofolate cyclohydrolase
LTTARLLDGVAIAGAIRDEVRQEAEWFLLRAGRPPGLGVVLVGDDPASEIYVRNKIKAAGEIGFRTDLHRLPTTTPLGDLLALVARLNSHDALDAILVQSPLPAAMGDDAERHVFDAISPEKDVDGFHPLNIGRLVQNRSSVAAGTPSGVMELLRRSGIPIAGNHAVVIGRSDIVGKPMALMLLHAHATVTICHSRTNDLPGTARRADILVSAIGRPGFITADFVKAGATVVDVGTTRVDDRATVERLFPAGSKRREAFERRGSLVVGDVHPSVEAVAGALSPVPGGVGPLTIAMLLRNTLTAARARAGESTEERGRATF